MRNKDEILLDVIKYLNWSKQDDLPAKTDHGKNENIKKLNDLIAEYEKAIKK